MSANCHQKEKVVSGTQTAVCTRIHVLISRVIRESTPVGSGAEVLPIALHCLSWAFIISNNPIPPQ